MNLVRRSLYLCIGVMLALLALQGVQSLWQVHRLSSAAEHAVTASQLAAGARELHARLDEAAAALARLTAFADIESVARAREDLAARTGAVAAAGRALTALPAEGGDPQGAARVAARAGEWLALASRHAELDGATELQSFLVI